MVIRENLNRVEGEKIDIHALIGKLPILPKKGFVLPWHKYTGPYNPLDKQLDENDQPIPGQEPYNSVDAILLTMIYVTVIILTKRLNVIVNFARTSSFKT